MNYNKLRRKLVGSNCSIFGVELKMRLPCVYPELGSSNVAEQIGALAAILPLLKDDQVVVIGDA